MNQKNATQRDIVLSAMQQRPDDFWPRGNGHVLLGIPGSPREQKAYHEPGGSFSPSPGSFGVSVWVRDGAGKAIASSDTIPIDKVEQHFSWDIPDAPPALVTRTPYYECHWSSGGDDRWNLTFKMIDAKKYKACVVIRSVGPAGGPLTSLQRESDRIIINHRWVLTTEPVVTTTFLVDEEQAGWKSSRPSAAGMESPDGWAAVRIELDKEQTVSLSVRDTAPRFTSPLRCTGTQSTIQMDLPDQHFSDSLNAQVAHLLMGYVGKQTCPGEPVNYPLAWERDGAYSVMAMARCGQVSTAMDLAVYFAENDFFGGFGAEGDAAGSAINALVGVALIANDTAFYRWIWRHVQRKITYIDEMLAATAEVRKPWIGPLCPHLEKEQDIPTICLPARDGLIVGSMDRHYPVLYINAMSYRGLRQASRLATILDKRDEAQKYLQTAARIQKAWFAQFNNPDLANERTYMSSLWPTWITSPAHEDFRKGLKQRWEGEHAQGTYPQRPLWTYFTNAEAHQWLFLDRPDIVWKTIQYFRDNQCSPGLYSYWEGNGEENTFRLWNHIRGWLKPPHVTPHYWTASEILLLQLDMLAYVDESGDKHQLVIGGGVPKEWLNHSMNVKGLRTFAGMVDWSYDKGMLDVTIHSGPKIAVRAGSSFAPGTKITVHSS